MEFMKLSPGEAVKYEEYWGEASGGEECVAGKEARAVLGRAARVSKTQLRLIWEIADHRKEGELDRSQFLIALRLIALAQRGAEIGVKGLRNFVGIQLIPDIAPAPAPAPAAQAPPAASNDLNAVAAAAVAAAAGVAPTGAAAAGFSWTVTADVIARYDNFFGSIDTANSGFVDGRAGVAFFGKSGLQRPVLKKVWQLADVTRDGKLDRDEFRSAMHMVANLRTGKLTEGDLPGQLDPAGPHWLRLEEDVLQQQQQQQQQPVRVEQHTPSVMDDDTLLFAAPPPVQDPRHAPQPAAVRSNQRVPQDGDLLGEAYSPRRAPRTSSFSSRGDPSSPRVSAQAGEDASALREKLRVEQQEAARAQRELEDMRAEIERLRVAKVDQSGAAAQKQRQESEVEDMRRAYQDMMEAKAKAEQEAAAARAEAVRLKQEVAQTTPVRSPLASTVPAADDDQLWNAPSPVATHRRSSSGKLPSPRVAGHHSQLPGAQSASSTIPPYTSLGPAAPGGSGAALGLSDMFASTPKPGSSGIALPPKSSKVAESPKKPPLGSSSGVAKKSARLISDDSMSESDDDDFWGTSGPGQKPGLGNPGEPSNGTGGGGGAASGGFGNDLDEWAF